MGLQQSFKWGSRGFFPPLPNRWVVVPSTPSDRVGGPCGLRVKADGRVRRPGGKLSKETNGTGKISWPLMS